LYKYSADLPKELRASFFTSGPKLLKGAIESVAESEEFKLPTPRNAACRTAALKITEWLQAGNSMAFEGFCKLLICLLMTCFEKSSKVLSTAQKKVWSNFHAVRISPELKRLWASNIEMIVQKPLDPILIQYYTQHVMEGLLKIRYPVSQAEASCSSSTSLTQEEENALRYAAGYIPFALRQELQRSRHPLKEDFIICLTEFCNEDIECTDLSTYSAQWVKQVNRGGLREVNDMVYLLCREIELEVRKYFVKDSIRKLMPGSKEIIVGAILLNEFVQFQCCMLSLDLQDDDAQDLLKMIADLWVTIRGFSFVKSWLESYKQAKGKGTAKSRSLRAKLQSAQLQSDL
jgi:hypothetical protein